MKRITMVGAAGALMVSALVGGTLISSALAAPTASRTTDAVAAHAGLGGDYLDAYLDALASELGVDRAALGPAAVAAANTAIDAAEQAGDITAERATELREQLATIDDPEMLLYLRGVAGGGPGHGPVGPGFGFGDAVDAAATALGLDVSELHAQLHDGSSLQEIADGQGVSYDSVVSAVTDAVSADLETAVSDGRITQDKADDMLAGLQAWLDGGGQPGEGGFGVGPGMGPAERGGQRGGLGS